MLFALVAALAISGLTAASALAAGAPTVETRKATETHGTYAYLNGYVNPNGAETKFWFEYGPTTSYGSKTKEQTTTTIKEPFKEISGLLRGTTYHFRLVAINSHGTTYGADETFTTGLVPDFKFKYEKAGPIAFSSKGGKATWSFDGGSKFAYCESSSISGEIAAETRQGGKTVKNTRILFEGCKYEGASLTGEKEHKREAEGHVLSEPLEGTLVYLSISAKTAGIDFKAQSGKALVHYCDFLGCGGEVIGSVVMPITPVNTQTSEFAITGPSKSEELEYEAGRKETATLETENGPGGFFPMFWELTNTLKLSEGEKAEIVV